MAELHCTETAIHSRCLPLFLAVTPHGTAFALAPVGGVGRGLYFADGSGSYRAIASAGPGVVAGIASAGDWVVWTTLDHQQRAPDDPVAWQLSAWNSLDHRVVRIARSRVPVPAEMLPAVSGKDDEIALSTYNGITRNTFDFHLYRFGDRTTRTIARDLHASAVALVGNRVFTAVTEHVGRQGRVQTDLYVIGRGGRLLTVTGNGRSSAPQAWGRSMVWASGHKILRRHRGVFSVVERGGLNWPQLGAGFVVDVSAVDGRSGVVIYPFDGDPFLLTQPHGMHEFAVAAAQGTASRGSRHSVGIRVRSVRCWSRSGSVPSRPARDRCLSPFVT